jgi:stage IV sporulation protein A
MEEYGIYNDITQRTDGDIYIGVVGPVRTGKSTFIKKFMEKVVIPNIENEFKRERAMDELPQSASGRTIMTTEPKFIPNEAVEINLSGNAAFSVRMIDCVGYIVDSALGYIEEEVPRMVNTPWFPDPIPFNKAAEIGTKKVITEHSTIGLMVTTDGSISDIPRCDYEEAEERVINELKEINKPFIVLLNCYNPYSDEAQALRGELAEKYKVPVMAVSCLNLDEPDIQEILETVLFEFPIKEISINMPGWVSPLDAEHWLKKGLYTEVFESANKMTKVREIKDFVLKLCGNEFVETAVVSDMDLGKGNAIVDIKMKNKLYYKILSEVCGVEIGDDEQLMEKIKCLSNTKREYDKVANALEEVRIKGYGIVTPTIDELTLEEPEIVKQGGKFGIKLRASAPSVHMIRADIETEVSPIVGSEKQSEELINYLMRDFEVDKKRIWQSNFFGKSLHELVNEGLHNKLYRMPEDARFKLQETLQKIINEGSGGLICIIL